MSLERLAAGFRPYLLLAVLVAAVALPGIASVPALDRDESRFAVASRQMVDSGDWVTVRFQDEIRAKKPPGIYWLQALVVEATGARGAIWAYRLPSALGILVAVLALFGLGAPLVGRPAALIGAALLATAPLVVSEAHQAKTDAVLLACAVIAQGALARFYLAARGGEPTPSPGAALLFWAAQAAAILVKGPIVPAITLLTIAALVVADRRQPRRAAWLRGLRPVPGIALVIVLVAPWAIAVSRATQGRFIAEAAGHDLLLKLYEPPEAHEGVVGTYLVSAALTLWPAILLIVPGLARAVRLRREPALRFCLAWAVPSWIMFEVVPTKLPHYVLPLVPALALLAGAACAAEAWPRRALWTRFLAGLVILVGAAAAAAVVVAPLSLGDGFLFAAVPCAVAAVAAGVLPALAALRGRMAAAAGLATVAAAATWGLLLAGVAPGLDQLWLSQRVARLVPAGAPVAATGYREPSLVFLLGSQIAWTDGPGAADFLTKAPGAAVVVSQADQDAFEQKLAATARKPRLLGVVEGLNYSRGRPARLSVWTLGAS